MTLRRSLPGLVAGALGISLTLSAVPAATASAKAQAPTTPTVSEQQVMPHLRALQRIADRNGGNRAHGTQGYADSVAYVKSALDRAGFRTNWSPSPTTAPPATT
ncbi:hypothetical protein [Streptomyces atratus]